MQKARNQFDENMRYVDELGLLHDHLKNTLRLPNDLSDILRSQVVYAISALDKFIHELIRIGMLQSFLGLKPKTDKFNAFTVSMNTLEKIQTSSVLSSTPPHFWFEEEINLKNKTASFQEPAKIADGLSFIWTENRKWTKIAALVGQPEEDLKKMLKNIVDRRNTIVHEADIDPSTETKLGIEAADVRIMVELINKIAKAIYDLVR
jgi:RiboL-PSP-HEPN